VKSCQSFSFLVRCPSNREAQTSQNWYLKLKDSYDSFGKLTASTGSLVNPFRYTARESDTETGLYYYCARYYDPANGRFANEDRLGFDGGEISIYTPVTAQFRSKTLWGCTYCYPMCLLRQRP